MARILFGSYMIRYPLGGMLSWALQYLLGLHRLGHDVCLVERADYRNACYDPSTQQMSDDPGYGISIVGELLKRFGLEEHWVFRDVDGNYWGRTRAGVRELFQDADLFIDGGTHGSWLECLNGNTRSALIDGEPGFTQMKWDHRREAGQLPPEYDFYYSNGLLLGTSECSAPTAGREWRPLPNLVIPELVKRSSPRRESRYTTVMNWQSHSPIEYQGRIYGQKDIEFEKIVDLPTRVDVPIEIAVAGPVPKSRLQSAGWSIRNAHQVTRSFDSYHEYIEKSRGEISVCKNVFVATRSGWFSDRSAAYLAAGRPVILQDTGFSQRVPTGEGLFAFSSLEDICEAIEEIESDVEKHSSLARDIAEEYFSSEKVLSIMLDEVLN